jgi:hypothetical protein
MTDDRDYQCWLLIEESSMRIAILWYCGAMISFTLAIGVFSLIFATQFTQYLSGWGHLGIAVLVSLAIGFIVKNKVWPFARDTIVDMIHLFILRLGVRSGIREVLQESNSIGIILYYHFFFFITYGSYIGLHIRADDMANYADVSARVFTQTTPAVTVVLGLLDIASGLGFLAFAAFSIAFYARIVGIVSQLLQSVRGWQWVTEPFTHSLVIFEKFSIATSPIVGPISKKTLFDVSALRVSLLSVIIGLICYITAINFPQSQDFFELSYWIGGILLMLVIVYSIARFGYEFYTNDRGSLIDEVVMKRINNWHISSIQQDWRTNIAFVILGIIGVLLYLNSVTGLPATRNEYPPLINNTLDIFAFRYPAILFEASRVAAIACLSAVALPIGYRVHKFQPRLILANSLSRVGSGIQYLGQPLTFFTSIMTNTEFESRWAPWVRVGLLIQIFGTVFLLQEVSYNQSLLPGSLIIGLGMTIQGSMAMIDLQTRHTTLRWWHRVVGFLIFVLPLVGGVGYVVSEYNTSSSTS